MSKIKIIQVDVATHKIFKSNAVEADKSIKAYLRELAEINENDIPFDVNKFDTTTLVAVRDDINNKLESLKI